MGDYSRPTRFCRISKVIYVYSQVEWFYELGPGSYPDLSSVFPYGFFFHRFFFLAAVLIAKFTLALVVQLSVCLS